MTYYVGETGEPGARSRCAWCGRSLAPRPAPKPGRRATYCRRSCRQRAYEARRRARELGAAEDELILSRAAHEELLDRLDVLARALDDVERDLSTASADDPAVLCSALEWLRTAAQDALGRR